MYTLNKYETETTITYNDAEPTATVYTCNRALMRRLDDLCASNPSVERVRQDEYSRTYEVPKKWVKIRPPRVVSEETKAKMRERGFSGNNPNQTA